MHNARCVIDIAVTLLCIIRDGVVVQMSLYARLGPREHLAFAQLMPRSARPIREFPQTAPELLAAGSAFDLEVSVLGLPAIVGEAEERKLRRFLPTSVRILRRLDQAFFQDSALKHTGDQPNNPWVANPLAQELEHPFMINLVEEAFDVSFYDLVDPFLLDRPAQFIQTSVLAASRSVALTAGLEYRLVDGLQNPLERQLHQLIFKTADTQWPSLLTAGFRDVAATFRLGLVAHPP